MSSLELAEFGAKSFDRAEEKEAVSDLSHTAPNASTPAVPGCGGEREACRGRAAVLSLAAALGGRDHPLIAMRRKLSLREKSGRRQGAGGC